MSSAQHPVRIVKAVYDAGLTARVVRRLPLYYASGADAATDRSAHVRAASGLAWVGDRLAVAQDDANFIALVDVASGLATSRTLPAGAGGKRLFDEERGNKSHKHDFESLVAATLADGTQGLLAFGSGSTHRRERICIIPVDAERDVRLVHVPALYSALRACDAFAGSSLNIEGAVRVGELVRLFGRGNGEISDGVERVNATCDLNWAGLLGHLENPATTPPPEPFNVVRFELGEVSGTRVTFTDAAAVPDGTGYAPASMLYTGAAEASKDAVLDGPVAGSVIGIISDDMGGTARFAEIQDGNGVALHAKVEGVAVGDFVRGQVFVVVDADDHQQPSELWELEFNDASHKQFQEMQRTMSCTPMYGTTLPAHEPEQVPPGTSISTCWKTSRT